MELTIELDIKEDDRIIAEVVKLPSGLIYGQIKEEVIAKFQALVLRVLADRVELMAANGV